MTNKNSSGVKSTKRKEKKSAEPGMAVTTISDVNSFLESIISGGSIKSLKNEFIDAGDVEIPCENVTVLIVDGINKMDFEEHKHLLQTSEKLFLSKTKTLLASANISSTLLESASSVLKASTNTFNDQLNDKYKAMDLPATDRFPRTQLLLSPLQMICEEYPMPYGGEIGKRLSNYTMTSDKYAPVTNHSPMYALDCEMCFTSTGQNELARVSLVDEQYNILYETLVRPKNNIVNYLTKWSGITAEMMENVTKTIDDVHRDFKNMLPPDAILVGQSLNFDLHSMKIIHPYVIDTSIIFNISGDRSRKTKLASLSQMFLKEQIQNAWTGHNSIEDSSASMKLVQLKLSKNIYFGDLFLQEQHKNRNIDQTSVKQNKCCYITTDSDSSALNQNLNNIKFLNCKNNEKAVKKTLNLCGSSGYTLTHIKFDTNESSTSTDEILSSVDEYISKIWNKIPNHGIFAVIFENSTNESDAVVSINLKR